MSFNAHAKGDNAEKSARLIDYLLTPKDLRQPPTLKALAEELGVSEDTLRNWRKEPRFARSMQERARSLVKAEKLPDIIEALYQTAISQTPQQVGAAKLLLDFMNQATPGGKIDFSELSDEDLALLAQKALEALTK